jgi:uncharacterized protein HemY
MNPFPEPTPVPLDPEAIRQLESLTEAVGILLLIGVASVVVIVAIVTFVTIIRRLARRLYVWRKRREQRQLQLDLARAGVKPLQPPRK